MHVTQLGDCTTVARSEVIQLRFQTTMPHVNLEGQVPQPLESLPSFLLSPSLAADLSNHPVLTTDEAMDAGEAADSDVRRMPHHPQLDASYAPAFGVPGVPGQSFAFCAARPRSRAVRRR